MSSRIAHSSGPGVALGLLAVTLAIALHAAFPRSLPARVPFAPFALAVLAACRWGGRPGGIVATVAGAAALHAWFLPAANGLWDEGRMGLSLFVAAGLFCSAQASAVKRKPTIAASPQPAHEPLPMFEYVGPTQTPAQRVAA